ncbi:hypothetical protein PIIN_11434 [Serendipita indica DSM 11827]|uniref:Uncharacterized protein n=1 Tax=Serendipita indica (strain DSM 11827) TaxID=1109443 RepID=G4U1L4_SERID|nr:hypothetical protein PIIN_11434 [Serendipita indica DSM 11827]
MSPSLQVSCS